MTPSLTQKRHKEVTQFSLRIDTDLISKKIFLLRGNQLVVFNFFCTELLQVGENTLSFSYDSIATQTSVNRGSIKTTMKRLRDDNLLEIQSHGGGNGTLIEVFIDDSILKVFARTINKRSDTEVTQIYNKKRHRSDTQPDTNASSKLVSNINNNLLTSHPNQHPENLLDVTLTSHILDPTPVPVM